MGWGMDAAPQPASSRELQWKCGGRGHHNVVNDGDIQRHEFPSGHGFNKPCWSISCALVVSSAEPPWWYMERTSIYIALDL